MKEKPPLKRNSSDSVLSIIMLMLLLVATTANAGNHWLSGTRTVDNQYITDQKGLIENKQAGASTVFDVVVSLHNNPTSTNDRQPYEDIIKAFADGVYESTNGAHKIGRVSIFTQGRFADSADVLWTDNGHPKATLGGYGSQNIITGNITRNRIGRIYMYDVFTGGRGSAGDYNFLDNATNRRGGGYTLAHEWGHYTYALLDEYTPQRLNDTAMMNSQWGATNLSRSNRLDFLNFSTEMSYASPDSRNTNHYNFYGASCWEVLTRPTILDFRRILKTKVRRIHFSDLDAVGPADGMRPRIDLPGSAQDCLEIIWQSDDLAIQIVIDRSGSMSGQPLSNAKIGANLLIDQLPIDTSVGIVSFSSGVSQDASIRTITSDSDRQTLKNTVNSIGSGGGTAIGEAANTALVNMLNSPGLQTANKVVFLLSDGSSNEGRSPASVIPDYQAAKVPLFTFAYGTGADIATLNTLATQTRAQLYISPTSAGAISSAFNNALQSVSSLTGLKNGSGTVTANSSSTEAFSVDSNIMNLDFTVVYDGSASDAIIELIAPDGTRFSPDDCIEAGGETVCLFSIPESDTDTGGWVMAITSLGNTIEYDFSATGEPMPGVDFSVNSENLNGSNLTYPEPLVVYASFEEEKFINNATVMADITSPFGVVSSIELMDDGNAPDELADDGIYSAYVDYNQGGVWDIEVSATGQQGVSALTVTGLSDTANETGGVVPPDPDEFLTENITRSDSIQVNITGFQFDDHSDSRFSGTFLSLDNREISGRIDDDGDPDFFRVNLPFSIPPGVSYVTRISGLSGGMAPQVRVYNSSGDLLNELSQANPEAASTYLVLPLPGNGGETLYIEVRHVSDTGRGNYEISAGEILNGEVAQSALASLYFLDYWIMRPNFFDRAQSFIAMAGRLSDPDNDFTPTDGMTVSYNGSSMVDIAPSAIRFLGGSVYLVQSLNQFGFIVQNEGGTSRSRFNLFSVDNYDTLLGDSSVDSLFESGQFMDSIGFQPVNYGQVGEFGSDFFAGFHPVLTDEFFLDSYFVIGRTDFNSTGFMALNGKMTGAITNDITREPLTLDMGWTSITVQPDEWFTYPGVIQAVNPAGNPGFVILILPERGIISVTGQGFDVPDLDPEQTITLTFDNFSATSRVATRDLSFPPTEFLIY